MRKRVITKFEMPEPIKRVTNRDRIYNIIKKAGKITFTQLIDNTGAKSYGNMHHNIKVLINEGKVKKITCKCCGITEQYEIT